MNFKIMQELLSKKGIAIDSSLENKFNTYASSLIEWNAKMNLTSIKEESEIFEKHFFDCLLLMESFDFSNKLVADIGSGAGFPGMVIALVNPSAKVTLIDSTAKKFKFLEFIKKELQIPNVSFHIGRVEDMKEYRNYFDVATSRGFSSLSTTCEVSAPLVQIGGYVISMKSNQGEEELKLAEPHLKNLGLAKEKTILDYLPSSNSLRFNIFLKKVKETPTKYPRPWATLISKPLW